MKSIKFLFVIVTLFALFSVTIVNAENQSKQEFPVLVAQTSSNDLPAESANLPDTMIEKSVQDQTVQPVEELPEPGAGVWGWLKWVFYALGGIATLRAIFFRIWPTPTNIDFWYKLWELLAIVLNYMTGGFVPNKRKGGGTF